MREITLFRPSDSRALYPYPSTHVAALHAQLANISCIANDAAASTEEFPLYPFPNQPCMCGSSLELGLNLQLYLQLYHARDCG